MDSRSWSWVATSRRRAFNRPRRSAVPRVEQLEDRHLFSAVTPLGPVFEGAERWDDLGIPSLGSDNVAVVTQRYAVVREDIPLAALLQSVPLASGAPESSRPTGMTALLEATNRTQAGSPDSPATICQDPEDPPCSPGRTCKCPVPEIRDPTAVILMLGFTIR